MLNSAYKYLFILLVREDVDMRCPNCGDDRCVIVEESETNQKGYGFGKGCCGYLILGPIGWVCGLCGMGKSHTVKRTFWVCQHCGRKFRT
jgi:DNA-directed RNA polymerase subunit RPC12/RpoP